MKYFDIDAQTFVFLFRFCTLCCPNGNFSHGKSGSLCPRKASYNRVALPNPNYFFNYKVHARSFHAIIHQILIWTTASLTRVRDYSYACVDTRWLSTATASQHIFDLEKFKKFSCAPDADGVRTSGLWISSLTLYQLSHPVTDMQTFVQWFSACHHIRTLVPARRPQPHFRKASPFSAHSDPSSTVGK